MSTTLRTLRRPTSFAAHMLRGYGRVANARHLPPASMTGDLSCPLCRGRTFVQTQALWPQLVEEWQLAPHEAEYVNRQQGLRCARCWLALRSMTLAFALTSLYRLPPMIALFLLRRPHLRVLEVNSAGSLHLALRLLPRTVTTSYPEVDMQALPFEDASFDLVVHSDSLEHVPDPVAGLRECLRVVRPRGWVCYTIPVVVGRSTRDRNGDPPSYHGSPPHGDADCRVHTEYGADMWTQLFEAGARECRIFSLDYPASLAVAGRR